MDNLLGAIVFILPGFLMYFWLQSFGINPVVKHTPGEFTAVAALLWLPASLTTLLIFNLIMHFTNLSPEVELTLEALKNRSGDILFLAGFLALSVVVSFFASLIWSLCLYPILMVVINFVRNGRGIASFSKNPSVWDEVFLKNDAQVVEIGRIDKAGMAIIGCIKKASRTFEPERHLFLDDVIFFTELVERHGISVSNVFYDTKSGSYVKIFAAEEIKNAQIKDELERATSSSNPY